MRKHILFEAELHDGFETLALGPTHQQKSSCTEAAAGRFVQIKKPEDAFSGDGFSFPDFFFSLLVSFLTSRTCHWAVRIRDAAAVHQLAPHPRSLCDQITL